MPRGVLELGILLHTRDSIRVTPDPLLPPPYWKADPPATTTLRQAPLRPEPLLSYS